MNYNQQQVIVKIAEKLNSENIVWGVGASMLLAQYGLVDNPADIDIIVAVNDIDRAEQVLSPLGTKKIKEKSDIYLTDFFYEYVIDSVEVDVMAGFKIKLSESVFGYKFERKSVPHSFEIGGLNIPFMTLEEWYVLYQLMPNREYKVNLLEEYFKKRGLEYPSLLEYFVRDKSVPPDVRTRINRWIN